MESEFTHGSTADATKVNGSTTTWRAWEFTSGTTVVCIKASIRMIKNMASAFTHGQTVAAMKGFGIGVSSMGWVPTWSLKTAS